MMRTWALAAVPAIVLACVVLSGVQGRAASASLQPAPAVDDQSGPAGVWALAYGVVRVAPDGTGVVRAPDGAETIPLTWRKDGDRVVLRAEDEDIAFDWKLDGTCLVPDLASPQAGDFLGLVRTTPAIARELLGTVEEAVGVAPDDPPPTDPASPAGTWVLVQAIADLKADGTGSMGMPGADDVSAELAWSQDGERVTLAVDGDETILELRMEGLCLAVAPDSENAAGLAGLLRITPETVEALANPERVKVLRERAVQSTCLSNLRQIATAMLSYAQDYDEVLPPADADWQEVLMPYVRNSAVFHCPAAEGEHSYFPNPEVLGHSLADFDEPSALAIVFESDDGESVVYRHNGGANYAFVDGHAKWFTKGVESEPALPWMATK
jgi:prepilin-type processing-associated H-X9-DG protein